MKRIYLLLAAAAGLTMSAHAQRIVNVVVSFDDPVAGSTINCTDSFQAGYTFVNEGPDDILPTDTFAFADFESVYDPSGGVSNIFIGQASQVIHAGDTISQESWMSHFNRIGTMVDTSDFSFVNPPFTDKGYILFGQFLGFGHITNNTFVFDDTQVKDTTNDDDIAGALITLHCGTGLNDLIGDSHTKATLFAYPNPATNLVSFKYTFTKGNAVARITDIAGRVVLTKDFGKQTAGEKVLSVDVSGLNAGMYYLELVTDDTRAIGKITVQK